MNLGPEPGAGARTPESSQSESPPDMRSTLPTWSVPNTSSLASRSPQIKGCDRGSGECDRGRVRDEPGTLKYGDGAVLCGEYRDEGIRYPSSPAADAAWA